MAAARVTVLTCLGWVLSCTALRQLAWAAGMAAWGATLWSLCVDTFVFVATLAPIADRRRGKSTACGAGHGVLSGDGRWQRPHGGT